jgi:hypothetical protein
MNYDRCRIDQLGRARSVVHNTTIGLSHIINTYPYRTHFEIRDICEYTLRILSELVEVLQWHVERPVHVYERPVQLIINMVVEKLDQTLRIFERFNNRDRLVLLIELKYDLKTIISILDTAREVVQWRTPLN